MDKKGFQRILKPLRIYKAFDQNLKIDQCVLCVGQFIVVGVFSYF